MLQINYIRQNTTLVKEKLAVKNIGDLSIVDKLLDTDEQVRKLKTETETLQAGINTANKEIGLLMGNGEKEAAENKKQEVTSHKNKLQELNRQLNDAEKILAIYPSLINYWTPMNR